MEEHQRDGNNKNSRDHTGIKPQEARSSEALPSEDASSWAPRKRGKQGPQGGAEASPCSPRAHGL